MAVSSDFLVYVRICVETGGSGCTWGCGRLDPAPRDHPHSPLTPEVEWRQELAFGELRSLLFKGRGQAKERECEPGSRRGGSLAPRPEFVPEVQCTSTPKDRGTDCGPDTASEILRPVAGRPDEDDGDDRKENDGRERHVGPVRSGSHPGHGCRAEDTRAVDIRAEQSTDLRRSGGDTVAREIGATGPPDIVR